MTYNILNYPDLYQTRNPNLALIINETEPAIVVVQEIVTQGAVNLFLSDVLGSEYTAAPFTDGIDTDNALFYKDSLFTLLDNSFIVTSLRQIDWYKLKQNITGDTLIIFSAHLKAGNEPANEQQRLTEATQLRNVTDTLPAGTNYLVVGDFNLYRSSEPAYQKLLDQSSPGYFLDPINRPGDWASNPTFAGIHTQSTRNQFPGGGSGGGLDDRFDFILASPSVMDEGGVYYRAGSYWAFGNDGLHFNQAINVPPFSLISQSVAQALHDASDHLPVYADFYFGYPTSVNTEKDHSVNSFQLYQNYPNPFNPVTKIRFDVPHSQRILITVYDIMGRVVKEIFNDVVSAGSYSVDFNAENLSSGMYIYKLQSENFTLSRKMILLK